jgi:hypothetical protein
MIFVITSFQENLSYTVLGILLTLIAGAIVGSIRLSIERNHKKRDQKREDLLTVLYKLIDIQYEIDPVFQSEVFANRNQFIDKYKEYVRTLLRVIPIIHIYTPLQGLNEDVEPLLEWMKKVQNEEENISLTQPEKNQGTDCSFWIRMKYSTIINSLIKIIEVELRKT